MSGTVDAASLDRPGLEAVARRAIPVAMGVWTWVVLLLVAAIVVSVDSVSILSILLIVVITVLVVPVYQFQPWAPGVTDRVLAFAAGHRRQLVAAAALFLFVRLPVLPDLLGPLMSLLLFPLRGVPQVMVDVRLFYGGRIGGWAGRLLFDAGRFYIEFLWLYLVGTGLAVLLPGGGE